MSDHVFIRVPNEISKVAIKEMLKVNNIGYWQHEKFLEKCSGFLKIIYTKQIFQQKIYEDDFIPLMSTITASYLGSNKDRKPVYYKYIIDTLETIGMIEVDHRYVAGNGNGKAKRYKLLLKNPNVKVDEEVTNEVKRILRVDDDEHVESMKRITVNEQLFILIGNIINPIKRDRGFNLLDYWNSGILPSVIDDNNRVHSLLTQLGREYRCALSVDGKQIFEVDISACQPFLFLKIVTNELNYKKKYKKTLTELGVIYRDINHYITLIKNNFFYEYLYRKFKKNKNGVIIKSDLSDFKINILSEVFFSKKSNERGIRRVFKDEFPTIYGIILKIKSNNGYKAIANDLQKLESELMNEIIDKIKDKVDWQIRLHDAILCTKAHTSFVQKIMSDSLSKFIGIDGLVKSNIWGQTITQVLNERWVENIRTMKEMDMSLSFKSRMNKFRNKTFGNPDDSKYEKLSTYYKRKHGLTNDPDLVLKDDNIANYYRSMELTYLSHWDYDEITAFKKYGLKIITEHLTNKLKDGLEFDRKLLSANIKFWETYFK